MRHLKKMPNDGALHEFRGLILFATGKYPQAAATAYAVLSVGPGWDWATLSSLYSDPNVYTQQLRALERFRNDHMNAPDIHFLAGYHYLVCGFKDVAAGEFRTAAKLNPKDELSRQIVASLTGKPMERPAAPALTAPAGPPAAGGATGGPPAVGGVGVAVTPVQPSNPEVVAAKPAAMTVAAVLGDWKASRDDGSSFQLKLTQDNRFAWKFTTKDGKAQDLSGTFTMAEGFLILKQDENSALVGQVKPLANNQGFNFKLVGDNPSDPGLNFGK